MGVDDTVIPGCPACGGGGERGDASTLVTCRRCQVSYASAGTTVIPLLTRHRAIDDRGAPRVTLTPQFQERYELGAVLGRGGAAIVFRARERATGRAVAVKFLTYQEEDGLARFLREARLLAALRHPRVVSVIESEALGNHPYLVAELLEGSTLRARMGKPMPPEAAVAIACDVLAGLHACHLSGIVHRDVKPENILFGADGRAKIADLGIAKDYGASNVTQPGLILGTPKYMSPEQGRGDIAGVAADIYAMGCVIYEMLAGRPPFEDEQLFAVIEQHQNSPVPPLAERVPGLPPALVAAVERALAKRVADRPASAEALAHLLQRATGAESRASRPPVSLPPQRPPTGLPQGQWRLAAGCAMMMVVCLLGLRAFSRPPPKPPVEQIRVAAEPPESPPAEKAPERPAAVRPRAVAPVAVAGVPAAPVASPSPRASAAATGPPEILKGHTEVVWSVAFSPDGRTLVSGGGDDLAILWDVATRKARHVLAGHLDMVRAVAVSPDGATVVTATASLDGGLYFWDAGSGKLRVRVPLDEGLRAMVFSRDGSTLLVAPYRAVLLTIDPQTGAVRRTQGLSRGGYGMATAAGCDLVALGREDGEVDVSTSSPWQPQRFDTGQGKYTTSAALSHDGHQLAAAMPGGVRVWQLFVPELAQPFSWDLDGLTQTRSVAFSPRSPHLAAGDGRGIIRIWNIAMGATAVPSERRVHSGTVNALAFSPDGSMLASASSDGTVVLQSVAGPVAARRPASAASGP